MSKNIQTYFQFEMITIYYATFSMCVKYIKHFLYIFFYKMESREKLAPRPFHTLLVYRVISSLEGYLPATT